MKGLILLVAMAFPLITLSKEFTFLQPDQVNELPPNIVKLLKNEG